MLLQQAGMANVIVTGLNQGSVATLKVSEFILICEQVSKKNKAHAQVTADYMQNGSLSVLHTHE